MNRMNTITDILLCKYLADPATPLTLNSVLGTFFFSLRTACLLTLGKTKYF